MAVKRKISFDLTSENRQKLESIKSTYGISYGDTINAVLSAVLSQSHETSTQILDFLKLKMRTINAQLKVSGAYGNEKLKQQFSQYDALARCFNNWEFLSTDDLYPAVKMQEIRLKNGLLVCPNDWIILNPEDGEKAAYAGVVECHNASIYGIPHFVWVRDDASVNNFSSEEEEHVKKKCCEKWPAFEDIIQKQVKLIPDPDRPGNYKNLDEWLRSPEIGFFTIIPDDSPLYNAEKEPPFGAKIIRDKQMK